MTTTTNLDKIKVEMPEDLTQVDKTFKDIYNYLSQFSTKIDNMSS